MDTAVTVGWRGYSALASLASQPGPVGMAQGGFAQAVSDCTFRWAYVSGAATMGVEARPVLFAGQESYDGVPAALVRASDGLRVLPEASFEGATPDLAEWRAMSASGSTFFAVSERRVWASELTGEPRTSAWRVLARLPAGVDARAVIGIDRTAASPAVQVGLGDGRILRGGGAWQEAYDGSGVTQIAGMERARGRDLAWGMGGALVSRMGGAWEPLGTGLEALEVADLLALAPGRYLAATDDGIWKLAASTLAQATDAAWSRISDNPDPDRPTRALQLFERTGFCEDWPCPDPSYAVLALTGEQAYLGFELESTFTGAPPPATAGLALSAPAPSPSSGRVRIALHAPAPGSLEAFDLLGRRVWRADVRAGEATYEWSGGGPDGSRVGAGVYLIVLRSGGETCTVRTVLL